MTCHHFIVVLIAAACHAQPPINPTEAQFAAKLGRDLRARGLERFTIDEVQYPQAGSSTFAVYLRYEAGPGCMSSNYGTSSCLAAYLADNERSDRPILEDISASVASDSGISRDKVEVILTVGQCYRLSYRYGTVGDSAVEPLTVCKTNRGVKVPVGVVTRLSAGHNSQAWLEDQVKMMLNNEFREEGIRAGEPRVNGFERVVEVAPARARVVQNRWERYHVFVTIFKQEELWVISLDLLGEWSPEGTRAARQFQRMGPEHQAGIERLLGQMGTLLQDRFP